MNQSDRYQHFLVEKQCGNSRAGRLFTDHSEILTPVLMPVGTQGAIKAILSNEIWDLGYRIILSNAYHLYLRPGVSVVEKHSNLHKMMNWKGAILTDSGGFQIYSLSPLKKIDDSAVTFRSHIDGSQHRLTPEDVVKIQETLGSDIIMPLDECLGYPAPQKEFEKATARTINWASRSKDCHDLNKGNLYAIIQGGMDVNLRIKCAEEVIKIGFPGYAIGGVSVGEDKYTSYFIVKETAAVLPKDKPRYLMGIGDPLDILHGVKNGIDLFDCVMPTRTARNGALYTKNGRINICRHEYVEDTAPIEEYCDCYCCRNYSKAYLRHLYISKEINACRLGTIHNLRFFSRFMSDIRKAILNEKFTEFEQEFVNKYTSSTKEILL